MFACGVPAVAAAQQDDAEQPPAAEEPASDEGDEEFAFPKFEDMQVPSAEELLTGEPRDWIVLKNADVIVAEPIVPRPDTLAKRQAEIEQKMEERRGKSGDELERLNEELDELNYLYITIPEFTENPEFRLELRRIDRIIHFEDLMLQRADLLLSERNIPVAFELLGRLARLYPDWPGLEARLNRLLFVDAESRLEQGELQQALVLFSELHSRQANYPGLSQRLGEVIDRIVSDAVQSGDYRRARYYLLELAGMYAEHPIFDKHAASMREQAESLLDRANDRFQAGEYAVAADLAAEAASLWPRTPNLLSRIRPFVERYQRLHVGVVTLPDFDAPAPYPARATQRAEGLMRQPLFELDRVRSGAVFYRTRYFDQWEPFDLGRRIHFTLSQTRQPWETAPVLDAPAFAALLEARLDPAGPHYDERFDAYVRSVRVVSPVEVMLTFDRVPARVEPLLSNLDPTGAASRSVVEAGTETAAADAVAQPGDSEFVSLQDESRTAAPPSFPPGFAPVEQTGDRVTFRRTIPEPEGLSQYHVAEVIEHRYASHEKALQALQQGEVSMLPHLPDWILRRVQDDDEFLKQFFIQPYALPRTHIVQINPQSRPLRLGELRRGLAYALDRETILRETVLRDAESDEDELHGRVVTSPFPADSFANAISVEPREYDLSAAVALVMTAAGRMENQLPPLRMLTPPEPVARTAAERLAAAWKRVGVNVELVDYADATAGEWDLIYRTLHMAEPTVELWPFLAASSSARVSDLQGFPDWLKQELIALDRTSDWNRAVDRVHELHRYLWSEALYIPLWEVDEFVIFRKNISGFPQQPVHCYQSAEHWTVEAWYAPE